MKRSPSADVRGGLSHPVIDSDAHLLEFEPALEDYLCQVGGRGVAGRVLASMREATEVWYRLSGQERIQLRPLRPPWGLQTKNAVDLATAILPDLLYSRLDELGIDYAIVYPTLGLSFGHEPEAELRQVACRALNNLHADLFADYVDRMTPVAVIPMATPDEAVAELDFAVCHLGLKSIMIASAVERPLGPETGLSWIDHFGIDSAYDYDVVWQRCTELGVSPTAHTSGTWGARTSPSNYVYNHIGAFADAGHALCKSLFLGGVPGRFPQLRFAFMEGGVGWACTLLGDLIEHWEKRRPSAMRASDPALLDRERLSALWRRHGGRYSHALEQSLDKLCPILRNIAGWRPQPPDAVDDFARCEIERKSDIKNRFVESFYFGCEADDRTIAWAFSGLMGARLRPIFGSDIGHWDAPVMNRVLADAHQLVERELLTPDDFEQFVFSNSVRLHGGANPAFFEGTAVEEEANRVLRSEVREACLE